MSDQVLAEQLAYLRNKYPVAQEIIDGIEWEFIDTGANATTLLLLPGALGVAETSFAYILAFAPTFRVISLSYPEAIGNVRQLVDGMAALLRLRSSAAVHVLGGSYSGFVAQYLAAWHPEQLASLMLSNTGAPSRTRGRRYRWFSRLFALLPQNLVHTVMQQRIRRFLPAATPVQQFWRDYFVAVIPTFSKRSLVNRLRIQAQMDDPDYSHVLDEHLWRGPTMILEADDDGLIAPADRTRLAARLPQAQVVVLKNQGHEASLDSTALYVKLQEEFICRLLDPAPGSDA